MKTAHGLYPKDYLQETLRPLPAGSHLVLQATYEGQDLLAIGYKYHSRKVLFFVATVASVGQTSTGTCQLGL